MRVIQILNLLSFTVLLSGCWTLGVSKGVAPGQLGNIDLLESLIGQKSEDVIKKLGLPNELLTYGDKRFMMYSSHSKGTDVLMVVWIPVPVATAPSDNLHCLRIELDSENLVKDYRVKSKSLDYLVTFAEFSLNTNCREVFWYQRELTKLQMTTDFAPKWHEIVRQEEEIEKQMREEEHKKKVEELLRQAKQGNADAQFLLYQKLAAKEPDIALRWLCESAEQGNLEARYTLGDVFRWGRGDVPTSNNIQAYVWYSLAGPLVKDEFDFFVEHGLSKVDLVKAKIALQQWQPGQCERELGLVQTNQ